MDGQRLGENVFLIGVGAVATSLAFDFIGRQSLGAGLLGEFTPPQLARFYSAVINMCAVNVFLCVFACWRRSAAAVAAMVLWDLTSLAGLMLAGASSGLLSIYVLLFVNLPQLKFHL